MKVVAYYTEGTSYEEEAGLLRASLDQVGMKHEITPITNRGDWYANTAFKSEFLRERRDSAKGPLVYLDVDAFVHHDCTPYFLGLAANGYDFGAHWFRGPSKGHDQSKVRDEGWWMLSGTLFLGDTPRCRQLLELWCAMNRTFQEHDVTQGGGQKNLWFASTCLEKLRVARLPGRFCYVFDKPYGYPAKEPMWIEHTIASRENRGKSKGRKRPERRRRLAELRKLVA